mmetsp:Transcript_45248/g.109518  ORF Transcript_45248/g.109518 Transcript_45248/m.109518 type:complete len:696 (-) Transcript_45248:3399-5486(-)
MILRSFHLLLVASATLVVTNVNAQTTSNAGYLESDPEMARFLFFLNRIGLSPGDGDIIMAPVNEAFGNLDKADHPQYEVWLKYKEQPEFIMHLKHVITSHVLLGDEVGVPLRVGEIWDNSRTDLRTASSGLVGNATITQDPKMIEDVPFSAIVSADIATTDGYINALSEVIWPRYLADGIINQLFDDRSWKYAFTTMANLILHTGMEDKIDAIYDNGLTLLVPPNRRFNRGEIDLPLLLSNDMFDYCKEFVLSHMVSYIHHSQSIFAKEETQYLLISERKTHLWVATTENQIRFQSELVLLFDQVSRAGLWHGIDLPLKPPSIRDFTDFTWKSTDQDTSDCMKVFINSLVDSRRLGEEMGVKLTMFCPSGAAFKQFNNEDYQRLLEPEWRRHCTEFLMNMITEGYHTRAELVSKAPSTITFLNGATYDLRRTGDAVRIKNGPGEQARSYFGDLIATDGYLHMTDRVITPTAVSRSVYDQTKENPDYSLVTENIDFVDMQDYIDRDLPITFLAPYDRAWWRVRFSTIDGEAIINRHIFRGLYFCDVIANMTEITSVKGDVHAVELRGDNQENLFIGGAFVFDCDILARNGVLHHIDRVLDMEYPTEPPTTSPAPTGTPAPSVSFQPSQNPAGPPPTVSFANINFQSGYVRPTNPPNFYEPFFTSGGSAPTLSYLGKNNMLATGVTLVVSTMLLLLC